MLGGGGAILEPPSGEAERKDSTDDPLRSEEFAALFDLADEKLLHTIDPCTLFNRKAMFRGTLFVSENVLAFSGVAENHRCDHSDEEIAGDQPTRSSKRKRPGHKLCMLPFSGVTKLVKSNADGLLPRSVCVTVREKDYFFKATRLKQKELFQLLEARWNALMDWVLLKAKSAFMVNKVLTTGSRLSLASVESSADADAAVDQWDDASARTVRGRSGSVFSAAMYTPLFLKLPADEIFGEEAACTLHIALGDDFVEVLGHYFLSRSFGAFRSHAGPSELTVVLPFAEVLEVVKGSSPLGTDCVQVITSRNLFIFASRSSSGAAIDIELRQMFNAWHSALAKFRKASQADLSTLTANATIGNTTIRCESCDPTRLGVVCTCNNTANLSHFIDNTAEGQRSEAELHMRWLEYLKHHGLGPDMVKVTQLAELVRGGIPLRLRGQLWPIISGAVYKKLSAGVSYADLVLRMEHSEQKELTKDDEYAIDKDLHRSFPRHVYYQTEEGRSALRRVLRAFSLRRKEIGYCQAMNIVAALFLLITNNEESAFWLLSTLAEDILAEYYDPLMTGAHIDQKVFEALMDELQPAVAHHLNVDLGVPLGAMSTSWFLCIFIELVPWPVCLRTLDWLLSEGRSVLFRVALAIFKYHEAQLLAAHDAAEVCQLLKGNLAAELDCNKLFQLAYVEFGPDAITEEKLLQLREAKRCEVVQRRTETEHREKQKATVKEDPSGSPKESSVFRLRYKQNLTSRKSSSELVGVMAEFNSMQRIPAPALAARKNSINRAGPATVAAVSRPKRTSVFSVFSEVLSPLLQAARRHSQPRVATQTQEPVREDSEQAEQALCGSASCPEVPLDASCTANEGASCKPLHRSPIV